MNTVLRIAGWLLAASLLTSLNGCGLVALPCRAVGAVVKVVPGVGHAAATPFDACASAID